MRLKELRKEKGLLQKEVAQRIGVCTQSYGFYENGINKPDPEVLIKLADCFECTIDYLVGRSDDFGNVNVILDISSFSDKEKDAIKLLGQLPDDLKDRAFTYIKKLSEIDDLENFKKSIK